MLTDTQIRILYCKLPECDYAFITQRVANNCSNSSRYEIKQYEEPRAYYRGYNKNEVEYTLRGFYCDGSMCYQHIFKDINSNTYICKNDLHIFETCYNLSVEFPYSVKNVKIYAEFCTCPVLLHFKKISPTLYEITDFTIMKQFIAWAGICVKSIIVEYDYDGEILPLKIVGNIVFWETNYRRNFLMNADQYMYADVATKKQLVYVSDIFYDKELDSYVY